MALKLIVKKLELMDKKFVTREDLRSYCTGLNLDYYASIRYLTSNDYLIRILRGIFYVKSVEERKLKKVDISYIDALKMALKLKGVNNWYFGLESAVKLNKLTHEHLAVESVISDSISRPRSIDILGVKVKFIKVNKRLFEFGLIGMSFKYSNIEKTVLDMIYLGKYNSHSEEEIKSKVAPLVDYCSRNRLVKYAAHYPKTVADVLRGLR